MKRTYELTSMIEECVMKTVSNRVNTKRAPVGIWVAHCFHGVKRCRSRRVMRSFGLLVIRRGI